jgi:GST-like protein
MIELHTSNTANGYRASIMLEECGLPYQVHAYALARLEHLAPAYLELNPVGRIPTIVDPDVAGGQPAVVYGTQAIVQYLAEKTGRFLPAEPTARATVYTWAGIIASDVGPAYSGQFAFNVLAREKIPYAIDFYNQLVDRMLKAVDWQLGRHTYLAGEEYTIADVLLYPVAGSSALRYPGNLDGYPNLKRWATLVGARPAVQRGMKVPS